MRRWILKGAFRLVVALIVFVALAGVYVFYRAMPAYSGAAPLPGLSANVRVWRDAHGVPHIFAENFDDAARALGYVHASERLYQMETQRRAGQGRLSEFAGSDLVGVDRFLRGLGLYRHAEASFAALDAETQARLNAYAAGVNAFLETHANALPPEFLLLGLKPEPWKPADSLVIAKLLALQLSHNYKFEIMRAQYAAKLPPEQVAWIFPGPPVDGPVTTQPVSHPDHAALDPETQLGQIMPLSHGASNEWVVAGARTTTGKPILANDPHLSLEAPVLWYLVRIVTPQGWVKGATLPGQPVVLLGQNQDIAWGITNAGTDVEDLFVETIDPQNPAQYLTPDGPKPFSTRQETIHVKGADDVAFAARETRHGPVLSDFSTEAAAIAPAGKVVALAFTALGDSDTTSEAFVRLNAAHNWDEFLAAMRVWQTPPQNLVFGDRTGDIGYISPGLMPVRKSGDGLAPTDGASGATDWTGWVPFEQLPQAHNPEAGFLFNANNAMIGKDQQAIFGRDFEETWRARRIQQFMDRIDKHSLDTSAQMQADKVSLAALAMKPILATIAPTDERARQALQLLGGWNGEADASRPEPLIFNAFLLKLREAMLTDRYHVDMSDTGPFDATTLISLIVNHPSFCDAPDKPDPQCRAMLAGALDKALAMLVTRDGADMSQWQWGKEHVAALTHKVFSHVPLLDRVSDLSVASGGDFYTLNRGGGFETPEGQPFARTHGAGFRGLYDLADPEASRFIITTGESGHIFSSHYGDFVQMWNEVKSFPLTGDEAALAAAGAKKLTFTAR